MRKLAVIAVWSLAAVLLVAVFVTATGDKTTLAPVTTQHVVTTTASTVTGIGTVSLNTATAEQLQRLPGLGEVLAERILAYRESAGGFRSVEDLLDVEGVGEKRLSQWRPYLTI